MNYSCPRCNVGHLRPIKSTFVRRWGDQLLTSPNFAAWRCDVCSYTRYDTAALAQVELLVGPDEESLDQPRASHARRAEGPDERGPRRWSS